MSTSFFMHECIMILLYAVGIFFVLSLFLYAIRCVSRRTQLQPVSSKTIPKIIHQTAPADERKWPALWKRCQETWKRLHPDFQYIMWTDEDLDDFVRSKYPDFYPLWQGYNLHIKRIDTVRYLILKDYGGIYADMDYECRERFYELLPQDKISIAESTFKQNEEYQNALMVSPKRHPFWDIVMDIVKRRYDGCYQGHKGNVLFCTGPNVIDAAVKDVRTRTWFHELSAQDFMDEKTARYAAHIGSAVWWHDNNLTQDSANCYVINLRESKDRLDLFKKRYLESDLRTVPLLRIEATDGRKMSDERLRSIVSDRAMRELLETEKTGRRTRHYQLSRGAVGCFLSHLDVLERIANGPKPFGIVFEDDAIVPKNVLERTHDALMRDMNNNKQSDLLFLGCICLECDSQKDEKTVGVTRFFLTHSYIVSKEGARKVLDVLRSKPIEQQIDAALSDYAKEGRLVIRCMQPNLVVQDNDNFASSIQTFSAEGNDVFKSLSESFTTSSEVPKVIWTYWHDPTKMPRVVRGCIQSWRRWCPDHKVRVLGPMDVERAVPDSKKIMKRFRAKNMSQAHISDYVRLAVLKHHGGIWVDASCLFNQSLDWIHDRSPGKDLVGFYHWSTHKGNQHPIIENFFLAAPVGSPFIADWHDELIRARLHFETDDDYVVDVKKNKGYVDLQDLGTKLPYLTAYLCAAVVQQRPGASYALNLTDAMGPLGPYKFMKKYEWDIEKSIEELQRNPDVRTPIVKFHNGVRDYLERTYF